MWKEADEIVNFIEVVTRSSNLTASQAAGIYVSLQKKNSSG